MILKAKLKESSTIVLQIFAENDSIMIEGYDSKKPNSFYFKRTRIVNGYDTLFFYLPTYPSNLEIKLFSESNNFKLVRFEVINSVPKKTILLDKQTIQFVKFIEKFSKESVNLSTKKYKSEGVIIDYLKKISLVKTPARIHKKKNYIQIDRSIWINTTVPARILILLHEYAHNNLNENRDNEIEADTNALHIFLSLGYPRIEAINGFMRIFEATEVNLERLNNIYNVIESYELNI